MPLLKEEDKHYLMQEFSAIQHPVKLIVFTQERECQYCAETRMIAEELAQLSDKLSVEIYDFVKDKEIADHYHVDKIPATILLRGGESPRDYNIRFYGIPSGYEFSSLIQDILMIGKGESGLSADTKAIVAKLKGKLHLQVFVTPTCPYCPAAVHLAHQMAFESDLISGDMVEAIEFPHLSNRYQVQGVPRTVINETGYLEGAAPEQMLIAKIKEVMAG